MWYPHQPVTCHFRNDAGGRNRKADTVTVDNSGLRQRKRRDRQTVDENVFGRGPEKRIERQPHRFVCCAQNVDGIDLDGINDATAGKVSPRATSSS